MEDYKKENKAPFRGLGVFDFISVVLMPLFMPLFGIIFMFQLKEFAYLPALFKWVTVGGTVLFTVLFPLVPMLFP